MTNIDRVRVALTGFVGGPGVNTFFALDGGSLLPDLRAYYNAIKSAIPATVTMQVENTGDTLNDETGYLLFGWSGEAQDSVGGTGSTPYAAPAGWVVNWLTSQVANHRRLRGRTFHVPAAGEALDSDGSVYDLTLTSVAAAATALVEAQGTNLVVWHRPVDHAGGSHGLVTSAVVHDKVAILTSRRD